MGRPPVNVTKEKKKQDLESERIRNCIEGKFGQAKRRFSLNRVMAKLSHTSETAIAITFLVMNLSTGNRPLPIYPEPIHSMALVPADINLAASEMQLSSAIAREYRLKNGLLDVQDNYDFILIDCPPSLGLLSIISLTAATHILVPIQCQFKSFKGTELLLSTITQVRSHTNPRLQFAGFVPTMFDGRTAQESLYLWRKYLQR